tara:strand:+ start:5734 stop:5967 length:234 start_codon:yes stop_codon:yes gene_type:complete
MERERDKMSELAEDLRQYRLENNLTWRGFAKVIGMSEAGLWKIARGKVTAGELTEYNIRKKLELITNDEKSEPEPVN